MIAWSIVILAAGPIAVIVAQQKPATVSIRGHAQVQSLPISYVQSWKTWTCELSKKKSEELLVPVEMDASDGELQPKSWVNPTSFDTLFLPSDLPVPLVRPALGIALAKGVPRYLMPSLVLTLETPGQVWRNRGLCSLPRARAWIDVFSMFGSVPLEKLRLSSFGQFAEDVRFLEDQDGSAAWQSLAPGKSRTMLRPEEATLDISATYDLFDKMVIKTGLLQQGMYSEISDGFHFIDIPLIDAPPFRLPTNRKVHQYLTDIEEPRRLLELEDPRALEGEPCGELEINVLQVGAGGKSKFLPEVYRELYEEGNIIVS
jgi:hypothetical protein